MEGIQMEYITLNNGVKMPLVGLGTWGLRGKECSQTVSKAIQLGYRLIDTAQMYENEIAVGEGIVDSGISRDKLFITTKLYRNVNSYEKAKVAIYESLKNLQLDYIDLILLHEPYQQGFDMYKALEDAWKLGIVKAIGISNYDETWYEEFIGACSVVPSVNQVENHIFYQKWNLHELLRQHGTAMQAWSPLAQGNINVASQSVLTTIARKYKKTPEQIALRFMVQRGISVIPKSSHEKRLKDNLDLFNIQLTAKEMKAIQQLDRNDTLFPWTKKF